MQPAAPAQPKPYPHRAALLTACAVLGVLFARRPEAFLSPQFFAEDGAVFYAGARCAPWGSIVRPYAGYLHLASRLVAALSSGLDPLWVPCAYFLASVGAVLALTLALFSRRAALPCPALLALGVVLVPHTGEVFDNLTNLQWLIALGLVVLLLAGDPESPGQGLADFAFAAVASLSGVFSILFSPLFAMRAATRRSRSALGIALVVCAGAAVQARAVLADAPPAGASATTPLLALATFGQRVWMSLLEPPAAADASPLWARAAAGAAGAVLLALLGLGAGASRRRRATLAAALALLVAAALYRFRGQILVLGRVENGDRYFFVPKVCLTWILAAHLRGPAAMRWITGALMAALAANSCCSFRFEHWRDNHWAYWAGRIASGERVVVPINPDGFTFVIEGSKGRP